MAAQKVLSVDDCFSLAFLRRLPPGVVVTATGTTSTSGWRNPRLEPRIYITPPSDGFLDLDFVAEPPEAYLQVLTQIVGGCVIDSIPEWARGIRIHAATNSVERSFYRPRNSLLETKVESDDVDADTVFKLQTPILTGTALAPSPDDFELDEINEEAGEFTIEAGRCHSFDLLTILNFPETKTEWRKKCQVKIAGKCRVYLKLPTVYRRTSKLVVEVTACWPDQNDIASEIERCAGQALAAGVLAGVTSGNLAAAAAAFEAFLPACLLEKGVTLANKVKIGMRIRKRTGPWKRV